jgi:hypothetical protein
LGYGQGNDTLFIAIKGHTVLGVDASQDGIGQILEDADKVSLSVEGLVADVLDFEIFAELDVAVIDRLLQLILDEEERKIIFVKSINTAPNNGST